MNTITDMPTTKEGTQIRALRLLVQEGSVKVIGSKGCKVELPRSVAGLLDEILKNLQVGKAVSIVPKQQPLTTQRAANLLGVSRPFLVRLVEEGKLPFHLVGSPRRVYLKDLLAYQKRRDKERHASINRMARLEMEAGTMTTSPFPTALKNGRSCKPEHQTAAPPSWTLAYWSKLRCGTRVRQNLKR